MARQEKSLCQFQQPLKALRIMQGVNDKILLFELTDVLDIFRHTF
jgi:hypothetical protein